MWCLKGRLYSAQGSEYAVMCFCVSRGTKGLYYFSELPRRVLDITKHTVWGKIGYWEWVGVTLHVVTKAGGSQSWTVDRLLGSELLNLGFLAHRLSGCDLQAGRLIVCVPGGISRGRSLWGTLGCRASAETTPHWTGFHPKVNTVPIIHCLLHPGIQVVIRGRMGPINY